MFIYLHNDQSVAVHIFCQQLLCSREMCQFLDGNGMKVWPWDVTREAARTRAMECLGQRFQFLVDEVSRMQVSLCSRC